ncbi:MAG: hypothetical protein KDH09_08640 [Chrysiogenetes bacterium]|nr:hypothetical protein [Chrysiogenetes bacterium]
MGRLLLMLVCLLPLGCGGETLVRVVPGTIEPVALSQPLFSASGIPGALFDECSGSNATFCDGVFDSLPTTRFIINVAGDTDNNDLYGVTVDPDGGGPMGAWTCYDNSNTSPLSNTLVAANIIANINDNSSGCEVTSWVQAKAGSVVVQALSDTVELGTNIIVGAGGNAGTMGQVAVTREDSDALAVLLDFVELPAAQEILDCHLGIASAGMAEGDCAEVILELEPGADTSFEDRAIVQAAGCGNVAQGGIVRLLSELTGTSDDAGNLQQAPGYTKRDTLSFEDCSFTADVGVAGGSGATTTTLSGSLVWTETFVDEPNVSTPATLSLTGSIGIDGDLDGNAATTGDPLWEGGIDFDVLRSDDGMSVTDSGGACMGGLLNAGADDCAVGGVFVPAAQWLP